MTCWLDIGSCEAGRESESNPIVCKHAELPARDSIQSSPWSFSNMTVAASANTNHNPIGVPDNQTATIKPSAKSSAWSLSISIIARNVFSFVGRGRRNRTSCLRIDVVPMLCPLSYSPILVREGGFEPPALGSQNRCSSILSYSLCCHWVTAYPASRSLP